MVSSMHTKCLDLASEALECLQSQKQGMVSSAVRKLELCARLLDDDVLKKWCDFHLGTYSHKLPNQPKTVSIEFFEEVTIKIKELEIPLSEQEILCRIGKSGGGYNSIEFIETKIDELRKDKSGNDRVHYLNSLLKTLSSVANAASKQAVRLYSSFTFGDIPRRQFDVIRERVDNLLLDICPDAVEKFMSAYEMLGSKSSEDWSLALTSCRRVIKAIADELFPATSEQRSGRKLGEDQYINRLWAFLEDNLEASSDKNLAKAHVDYLGSFIQRLNDKASKGVHATVTYEETVRVVLYTYLTLGDILEFASVGLQSALGKKGRLDINSATYQQMCSIPGITSTIAKEIIKKRTKAPFISTEELVKMKGFGPKTLEKLEGYLMVLPKAGTA